MSGCPSLWPWPRSCTTAHSAPEMARAGKEDNEMHFTATFRANPPPRRQAPSTLPWTWMRCLSRGRGLTGSRRSGCRSGFCGAPWSRTSNLCVEYRFLTLLCRRWWNTLWMSSRSSTGSARAGYRSAQGFSSGRGPAPCCSSRAAAGGTIGGRADGARVRSCCRSRAKPLGGGMHGLCSSSSPPGQGGI